MPFASHAPRPYSRSPSTRLGKNGGTQSKCVENVTSGGRSAMVATTLNRVRVHRLAPHAASRSASSSPADHCAGRRLAAGRRVDVDELSRDVATRFSGSTLRAPSACRCVASRYFTMTGVASERPHSCAGAHRHRARAGHHHRAFGHDERLAGLRRDDAPVRQVVDRRRPGEDGARRDHRPRLDHRALVDAGVAARPARRLRR